MLHDTAGVYFRLLHDDQLSRGQQTSSGYRQHVTGDTEVKGQGPQDVDLCRRPVRLLLAAVVRRAGPDLFRRSANTGIAGVYITDANHRTGVPVAWGV